jgi:protein-tyrosine phosphatase
VTDRHLDWDGCWNLRDLGGLPTRHGRITRWRSVIRGDGVGRLSDQGWRDLRDYGIRTVIDLRNAWEIRPDLGRRPSDVTTLHLPLDDEADEEFWSDVRTNQLDGSPLYYRPFLDRKPQQAAAVLTAIAEAPDGGVLFHCAAGRDRTGLVSLLLLMLADVEVDHIVADYEASTTRLQPAWSALGLVDQGAQIRQILDSKGVTAAELLTELVASVDVVDYLTSAGMSDRHLWRLRGRLLGEAPT